MYISFRKWIWMFANVVECMYLGVCELFSHTLLFVNVYKFRRMFVNVWNAWECIRICSNVCKRMWMYKNVFECTRMHVKMWIYVNTCDCMEMYVIAKDWMLLYANACNYMQMLLMYVNACQCLIFVNISLCMFMC